MKKHHNDQGSFLCCVSIQLYMYVHVTKYNKKENDRHGIYIQGFILRFIVLSHFSTFISFVNKGNKGDRETNDQQDGRQYKMLRTENLQIILRVESRNLLEGSQ